MPDQIYRRCPRCNALIRKNAGECPECSLLDQIPEPLPDKDPWGSIPGLAFLRGLGIPADLWIVTVLWIGWFATLCFTDTFGHAAVFTLAAFGFPLMLILRADQLSQYVLSPWGRPIDPIDPLAVKLFAWVVILGSQIWFVYRLFWTES